MRPTPSLTGKYGSSRWKSFLSLGLLVALSTGLTTSTRADFLYITDVGNNSIVQYDTSTNTASVFATSAKIGGPVDAPFDIQEFGGNLYFALLGTSRIMEYNETAKTFSQFNLGTNNSLAPALPGYIAFQTIGATNFMLVNDFANNQVLRFNLADGSAAPASGQSGAVFIPQTVGTNTLHSPTGLAVNASSIFVVSSGTTAPQIYVYGNDGSANGTAIGSGQPLPNAGAKVVAIPAGFAGGNVAVTSFGDNHLYDYKNNGNLSYTATDATMNKPAGFAFSQDNKSVFIANSGSGNLLQFDNSATNGVLLATLSLSGANQANTPIPIGVWDRATAISTPLGPLPLTWPGPTAFGPELPEPSSVILLGVGVVSLGTWCCRKKVRLG